MSRRVVSYDDLAPSSTDPQAASVSFTNSLGGARQHTTEDASHSVSPASKKRRREETSKEGNGSQSVEKELDRVREGGGVTSGNLSLFQSLSPKPHVKRGRNKRHSRGGAGTSMLMAVSEYPVQHWDDPGAQADRISYDENTGEVHGIERNLGRNNLETGEEGDREMAIGETGDDEDEDEEDESRELTHEEIWDDSALVAAWDAANEEYEAIHGKTKRWKKERAHKSPLWYNIPPEKTEVSSRKGKAKTKRNVSGTASTAEGRPHSPSGETDSSVPLNFETYVPTHDPSLAFPGPPSPPGVPEPTQTNLRSIALQYSSMLPASLLTNQHRSGGASTSANLAAVGGAGVTADEALSRALGATYWCGYWTAVYHRAHEQGTALTASNVEAEDSTVQEEEATELLSTQR